MNILALVCAAAIGVVLGALGGGGSLLTVPVFVYVLHCEPRQAIAMSLPVVGITSLVGAFGHWREGHIEWRPALTIGALAMAGAYGGARLAVLVSGTSQLTLLGVVMAAASMSMLRSRPAMPSPAAAHDRADPPRRSLLMVPVLACGIGVLTGLIGIGGGFLFVPALMLLARMPMKRAIGTSLVVIAMNSAAGFAGYVGRVSIPWDVVTPFVVIASAGIIGGVYLVRVLDQSILRRAFGVFLLLVAGWMLYENLTSPRHATLHDLIGFAREAGTIASWRLATGVIPSGEGVLVRIRRGPDGFAELARVEQQSHAAARDRRHSAAVRTLDPVDVSPTAARFGVGLSLISRPAAGVRFVRLQRFLPTVF